MMKEGKRKVSKSDGGGENGRRYRYVGSETQRSLAVYWIVLYGPDNVPCEEEGRKVA
jgi:hypothetical protein